MRTWRSCWVASCTRLVSVVWHSLAVGVNHAMARLRSIWPGAGYTVPRTCMVKCHHPKSPSYCSTVDGESSYVFRPMLDRPTRCFGSSAQGLFVSAQMVGCFMQTLFQVMLSPAEVLTQPKVRQVMFQLAELIH